MTNSQLPPTSPAPLSIVQTAALAKAAKQRARIDMLAFFSSCAATSIITGKVELYGEIWLACFSATSALTYWIGPRPTESCLVWVNQKLWTPALIYVFAWKIPMLLETMWPFPLNFMIPLAFVLYFLSYFRAAMPKTSWPW